MLRCAGSSACNEGRLDGPRLGALAPDPCVHRERSTLNASGFVDHLTRRVDQLIEQPRSGRIVERYNRDDLRELIESGYRIIYLILPDRIDIVTVRDSRRVLPRSLRDL